MFAATWDQQGFVVYSSALKSVAIKLSKISSDLILLASGPRAGLGEINLPALQPGSSIMPGKVNPVIPEVVNIVAFRVMGNDYAVGFAAHSGQLQLNAYEPLDGLGDDGVAAPAAQRSKAFRTKCVDGITVNEKVLARYMETTVGIVTALNPVLGYEKATELANEAYTSGKGILEVIREKKVLTEAQIKELLDPGEADQPGSEANTSNAERKSDARARSQENAMMRLRQSVSRRTLVVLVARWRDAGRRAAAKEAERRDPGDRRHDRRRRRDAARRPATSPAP